MRRGGVEVGAAAAPLRLLEIVCLGDRALVPQPPAQCYGMRSCAVWRLRHVERACSLYCNIAGMVPRSPFPAPRKI